MFSVRHIELFRQQADPLADRAVESLFAWQSGYRAAMLTLERFTLNQHLQEISGLPEPLTALTNYYTSLPAWADKQLLERASTFFSKNQADILLLLGCYSLPYCYAAAKGAQVLWLSERLRKNTYQRLMETGTFVLAVGSEGGFRPEGNALATLFKVRLIHAAIRTHIKRSAEWNAEWGMPINQDDMAGTLVSFSLIVLRGLRKLAIPVTDAEAKAWLHLWSVSGHFLGIPPEILPMRTQDFVTLEQSVRERLFEPSEAGRQLTKALINSFYTQPAPAGVPEALMRTLLGEQIADLLQVPRPSFQPAIANGQKLLNWLIANGWGGLKALKQTDEQQQLLRQLGTASKSARFPVPGQLRP